jgi:quercetin dioxygenase-like cupin family protein
VLAGTGVTTTENGSYPLTTGDTLLIPPGEKHATRNTGDVPLQLLCFFPVADITRDTQEPGVTPGK